MSLELVVVDGAGDSARVPVHAGMVIGRRPDCDLQLAHDTVSGRHARIVEDGGTLAVEDLGSQNKTVVEGGPVLSKGATHPLAAGMTLLLGKVRLRLEGEDEPGDLPTLRRAEEPGPTMADPGATLAAPGATAAPATRQAPRKKDDSSVIPDWRMERPSDAPVETSAPAAPAAPAGDAGALVTMRLAPDLADDRMGDLVSHAALEALRPRLVVDNDLARRVVDIRRSEFTIGREGCDMNVAHAAVSGMHAKIVFDPIQKRLRLVDLGSKNFTFLSGEMVPPDVPREIAPHSHVRVGPIDLLFVMDKDYDGSAVPERTLQTAAELLEADGSITPEQRRRAIEGAKAERRDVGEMLVLAGAIGAKRWVRALEHAEIALVSRSLPNPELKRLRLAVIALCVAVLVLLVLVLVL